MMDYHKHKLLDQLDMVKIRFQYLHVVVHQYWRI